MRYRTVSGLWLIFTIAFATEAHAVDVNVATRPATTQSVIRIGTSNETPFSRRFVFICDVSESMRTKMPMLQRQLVRTIRNLRATQGFDIVLMGAEEPVVFAPSFVGGGAEQRKRAQAFVENIQVGGPRGSLAALDLTIRSKPDVVYLLVDRDFPTETAGTRLREINADRKVKVDFVAFAASTEEGGAWVDKMKTVADENRGNFVREDTDLHSHLISDVGDSHKIAFVIDDSSPFQGGREISDVIFALPSTAEFCILTLSGNDKLRATNSGFLSATLQNKRNADDLLEVVHVHADGDPIASISRAFALKPDLIVLTSSGDFPNNEAAVTKIAELNRDRKVRINTITWAGDDSRMTSHIDAMKKIAKDNGGTFRK